MARARNIKPGFYKNEDLAECSIWARYIFPGLWMLADREGRLEDRPKRIKGELIPFDAQDVEPLLRELSTRGFIQRYQIDGASFIQISKFKDHQTPHYSEKKSVIKAPELQESKPHIQDADSEKKPPIIKGKNGRTPFLTPPDCLNPDSPNPDSLIPDSPILRIPKKNRTAHPAGGAEPKSAHTWTAFNAAYRERYGVDPTENARTRAQMVSFLTRVPLSEAPEIAAFYVRHNGRYYVQQKHPVGMLCKDAEGLRTEWLTGRTVTATEANQTDKTQATGNAFAPLIAEAEERERLAHAK